MKESLTAQYNRLYVKYSSVGCPATKNETSCVHPDLCADHGCCLDQAQPNPTDKEPVDGSTVQEK